MSIVAQTIHKQYFVLWKNLKVLFYCRRKSITFTNILIGSRPISFCQIFIVLIGNRFFSKKGSLRHLVIFLLNFCFVSGSNENSVNKFVTTQIQKNNFCDTSWRLRTDLTIESNEKIVVYITRGRSKRTHLCYKRHWTVLFSK